MNRSFFATLRCTLLVLLFMFGVSALAAAVSIKAGFGPAHASPGKEAAPASGGASAPAGQPQQGKDGAAATPEKAAPAQTFPGLADVALAAAEVARKSADAHESVSAAAKITPIKTQTLQSEGRLQKLREQIESARDLNQLDGGRLADASALLLKEKKLLEGLIADVSSRLNGLETAKTDWEKQRAFWQDWRQHLLSAQLELPTETFAKAQGQIDAALEEIGGATGIVVALQEKLSQLLQESISLYKPVEAAAVKQRSVTLKSMDPSFFNRDFYAQFNAELWASVWTNASKLWRSDELWETLCGGCLVAHLALITLFFGYAVWLRAWAKHEGGLSFALGHPFWTAVFLSEIIAVVFFPEPIGLWRFTTWGVFVLAETGLAASMLRGSLLRFPVFYLAGITLLFCVVKSLSIPAPLFRVLMAFCSGLGAVLFLRWARLSRAAVQEDAAPRRLAPFWILMLLGLILAVIFLAQLLGLVKAAERLQFEVLGLITLGVGAFLCLRIVEAGVSLAVRRSPLARLRFFSRFGGEITARVHFVLRVAIAVLTMLGLFRLMGVYGSAGQAFERVFSFSITLGSLALTPGVLLLALFLMYLANSLSWFLRAVLDAEIFPRKQMDTGASHAISKLLHYFLMFIGFLMAMSVIGLEMKNFAVLGGALGIGVGFGLQNIVNNFMSGLILLFERPIKVGDRVVVDADLGVVKRIGLRSTVIQTFDYSELIVPNSQFISAKVTNMTLSSTMARLKIPVGAAYGSDIEQVLRVLREAGEASPRVTKDPAPLALMLQFGASSLDFELQVWLPNIGDLALARSEICQDIARRFQDQGIEIPFPQCDVRLRRPGEE